MFKTAFAAGKTFERASKASEASSDDRSRTQAVAATLREHSCLGSPSSSAFHTGVSTPVEEELPIYKGYLNDSEFRMAFAKRLKEKLAQHRKDRFEGLMSEFLGRPSSSPRT